MCLTAHTSKRQNMLPFSSIQTLDLTVEKQQHRTEVEAFHDREREISKHYIIESNENRKRIKINLRMQRTK